MAGRIFSPGDHCYESLRAGFAWQIPENFNIGSACTDDHPANDPAIIQVQEIVAAMAGEQTASDYAMEIENQQRIETRSAAAPFTDALVGFNLQVGG